MSDLNLQSQGRIGQTSTANRIVMAPMTRARTTQPGDIPNALMAEYYAQRASAGLIISEATQISPQGQGYSYTPGIFSEAHLQGWKLVTEAVHQAEGKIFSQLWHVGRMSHESFHTDGKPVAPSAIEPMAQVWIVDENGEGQMLDCPTPRALNLPEIRHIIADYRQAASNAINAGFDGVEIHAANGYLIDQFMRRSSNTRTDNYGGSIENRIRFACEVTAAVCETIGAEKVGIRLAPFITQRGMNDSEAIEAILQAARYFNDLGIAYIHLAEADWEDAPVVTDSFRHILRDVFDGAIIVAGNFTQASGEQLIQSGMADYIAYGRKFITNPDLPRRFAENLPLECLKDKSNLFGGTAIGYTDYPALPD
ncbi:alkene reductase [Aliamphritea ceti]|uniref:alkene reductase n=1 Tax=Aliamphritea ceti TaxID=1524258 RepID=UPI0021C424EF|nr:alkene reductase [Aliamphritea ceti]